MSLSDTQRRAFEDRLKRIHRGGPNTSGTLLVGPQDDPKNRKRSMRRMRRGPGFFQRLGTAMTDLFLLPVGFVLGGLAMMTGVVAAFHLNRIEALSADGQSLSAMALPYSEFAVAGLVALALGWTFKLTKGVRKLGLVAGLAAVFLAQETIIDTYPDVFARLMSDDVTLDAAMAALGAS